MIYVVDKSGGGDFTSIQSAVDALPCGEGAPTTIVLRNDEYRESIHICKNNVRLVGEARERVLINMQNGECLRVYGNDVEINNIMFTNTGETAFQILGDRFNARNCFVNDSENALSSSRNAYSPIVYLAGDIDASRLPFEALPERSIINDCTVRGCSSKSFISEKRLAMIELCLRDGDIVLIGFDGGDENPDPCYHTNSDITYPEYLAMCVYASRDKGATPIFVTQSERASDAYTYTLRAVADAMGVNVIEV